MIDINSISHLDHGDNPTHSFNQWYKKNPIGEKIIYFHGFLAEYMSYRGNELFNEMQQWVFSMNVRGKVQLSQFKHEERKYSYIARKMTN